VSSVRIFRIRFNGESPNRTRAISERPVPADLVFASEYFEHFEEPIAHLVEVVELTRPRALLIANAFSAKSIGHFDEYVVDGRRVSGDVVGRRFNDTLRRIGYSKIETRLWNNRPAYWKRAE
jgi:hypothetical protein